MRLAAVAALIELVARGVSVNPRRGAWANGPAPAVRSTRVIRHETRCDSRHSTTATGLDVIDVIPVLTNAQCAVTARRVPMPCADAPAWLHLILDVSTHQPKSDTISDTVPRRVPPVA